MPAYSKTIIKTPLGMLAISVQDGFVDKIYFDENLKEEQTPEDLSFIAGEFKDYFSGKIQTFHFDVFPKGTPFQLKVWEAIQEIPYGETRSYGEIATHLGLKNGARAVGLAVGANPLPLVIPCHRVIGTNGKLTGYSGGLERKKWLLRHEAKNSPFHISG